jgi:aminopeptidase N
MLDAYLGSEKFQSGLHLYLSQHSYSNAVTEVLSLLITC